MPLFSTLFFGIKEVNRRSFYCPDTIKTINENTEVDRNNNFNGIITRSEDVGDDRHVYNIDNVVHVETINPKKETEIVSGLENDFNNMGTFTCFSVCTAVGSTVLAVYGINPSIPGTNKTLFDYVPQTVFPYIGGLGFVTSIMGVYRSWDLSNELKKWRKNINFHQRMRTHIPKIGTKKIYDNRMLGVYVTHKEGLNLWKNDVKEYKNNAQLATYRLPDWIVNFVEKFNDDHPLEPKYARYFCDDPMLQNVTPFVDACTQSKARYIYMNDAYEQEKRTLSYKENNEIDIATQPFDIARNVLTTVKTVDTIIDTSNEIAEDINDSQRGQTFNERRRKEFSRGVGHMAKDTTYILGQASIESIRRQTVHQINEKYDAQRRQIQKSRNENVASLLPEISNTYRDCCAILL